MTHIPDRWKDLRERLAKATLGPWDTSDEWRRGPSEEYSVAVEDRDGRTLFDTLNRDYRVALIEEDSGDDRTFIRDQQAYADMQFAAHARTDLADLLAERDRLAGIAEELASFFCPTDDMGNCFWCRQNPKDHRENCPYLMAVEWAGEKVKGDSDGKAR